MTMTVTMTQIHLVSSTISFAPGVVHVCFSTCFLPLGWYMFVSPHLFYPWGGTCFPESKSVDNDVENKLRVYSRRCYKQGPGK